MGERARQVSLRARAVRVVARDEGDGVRVEVHNLGTPIPAERLQHIFDPFVRGRDGTRSGSRSGLGLGLYITNEIVKAHGGVLQVRSTETEGTCFWLKLPRHPPSAPKA